jgi:hypothetical protein
VCQPGYSNYQPDWTLTLKLDDSSRHLLKDLVRAARATLGVVKESCEDIRVGEVVIGLCMSNLVSDMVARASFVPIVSRSIAA